MSQDETYGDQRTLQSMTHLYNVHIRVLLTLVLQELVDINEENGMQTLVLGYFAEGQGDHYICLQQIQT